MKPLKGMTVKPDGEEYMRDAFISFVNFALSDDDIFSRFMVQATKDQLNEKDPEKIYGLFADWVAINLWSES